MSDGLKSLIRTWWPLALGQLTTLLVAGLATRAGIEVPGDAAYAVVSAVVTGLVYAAGRWLESRPAGVLRSLGRFIVSLGLVPSTPTYSPPATVGERSRQACPYGR